MSLINDALKKAQRERDRQPAAPEGPGGPVESGPSSPPSSSSGKPWWIAIVILAAAAAWFANDSFNARSREKQALASPSAPAPSLAPAVVQAPAASTPLVAAPTQVQATPTRTSANPAPATTASTSVNPVPAKVSLEPVRISPEAERARLLVLVNQLRVSGVRITDRGNRALINDRLVKVGDPIDGLAGLRVKEIDREQIVLVDENGQRYLKRLQ